VAQASAAKAVQRVDAYRHRAEGNLGSQLAEQCEQRIARGVGAMFIMAVGMTR
jgi:hypothetical protein